MRRILLLSCLIGLAVAGFAGTAAAIPVFTISGNGIPNGAKQGTGDIFVDSVAFGGKTFLAQDFIYAQSVANYQYTGGLGNTWISSGVNTTGTPSDRKWRLEEMDGTAGSISAGDKLRFATEIKNAFNSNNLNYYLDLYTSSNSVSVYSYEVGFGSAITDLIYFERGAGGSNSWVKSEALDAANAVIGTYVHDPLTGRVNIAPVWHWWSGTTEGSGDFQMMSGYQLNASLFGLADISKIRVSNPTGNGTGETAADVKMWGVNSIKVPEPATMLLLGLGLIGLASIGHRRSR